MKVENLTKAPNKSALTKSIRSQIAEYLKLEAERFFIDRKIDYRTIPKKDWPKIKASVENGQSLFDAMRSPTIDPIADLQNKPFEDLSPIFKQTGEFLREHHLAWIHLVQVDYKLAKKVPAALAVKVSNLIDARVPFEAAIERAKNAQV